MSSHYSNLRHQITTELHPCSIEALQRGALDSFVCGSYELQEDGQYRRGCIQVYDVEGMPVGEAKVMESGVLDMKLSADNHLLACALSSSQVDVMSIVDDGTSTQFTDLQSVVLEDSDGLVLSLCWDDGSSSETDTSRNLVISTQSSAVCVLTSREASIETLLRIDNAHELLGNCVPTWIVSYDCHTKSRILSGGDDCQMKLWDLREPSQPIGSNKKSHSAGVTTASWNPVHEHNFCTGSYDEHVRIWDDRNLSSPTNDFEIGGGIWRVKWNLNDDSNTHILAAAMHAGAAVISCKDLNHDGHYTSTDDQIFVHEMNGTVERLVYGIDVIRSKSRRENVLTLVSCSFYDNLIHIWDLVTDPV